MKTLFMFAMSLAVVALLTSDAQGYQLLPPTSKAKDLDIPTTQAAPPNSVLQRQKASAVAKTVAAGAGKIIDSNDVGNGAAVMVFAEDHASVTGQLQQAIMLTRLHDRFSLRDVVLEGYSSGDLDTGARQIRNAITAKSPLLEQQAARLLGEGEISSAEFLAISFPDVRILKGETESVAGPTEEEEIRLFLSSRILLPVLVIARNEVSKDKATVFLKGLEKLLPIDSVQKMRSLIDSSQTIIDASPWMKTRNDILFGKKAGTTSIEEQMLALQEIQSQAARLPPQLAKLAGSTSDYYAFLKKRSSASDSMAAQAVAQASQSKSPVIALVIGAAHTKKVAQLLRSNTRAFAVITSSDLESPKDVKFSGTAYERKMKRGSVSNGLGETLYEVFKARRNHPPPVVERQWIQAKGELYAMIDTLARAAGGSGPPPTTNSLLAGFSEDRSRGRFVQIDRRRIEVSTDGDRTVLIFPVVLNRDATGSKTIWVKLGITRGEVPNPGASGRAEAALREVLDSVRSDATRRANKKEVKGKEPESGTLLLVAEEAADAIRVSKRAVMVVAESKEAVTNMRMNL